jgi:hypothetical protein
MSCDCDCQPGAHWCILCEEHGALTRELGRAEGRVFCDCCNQLVKGNGPWCDLYDPSLTWRCAAFMFRL